MYSVEGIIVQLRSSYTMRTKCAISYAASEIALLRSLKKNVQLIGNTCPEPHWHSTESRVKYSAKTHRDSTQSRNSAQSRNPHFRKKVQNIELYCVLSEIAESTTAHGASATFAVG